jgi:predicted GNAT superfamily acetyltransferase
VVILKDLHEIGEFRQVIDLEHRIWGYADLADVVTVPVFIITVKRGAILIGAFDDLNRMVGFVYSIAGMKNGKPMQWSHMAGVLPEYRNKGLGRDLKLAQRERALAAGFDLIEWTFDPLQAGNAHLNFTKLGVVCDEYAVNIYGDSSSALHRGTPTDRFVVQWNIREPHVERRLQDSGVPGSGVPGSGVPGSRVPGSGVQRFTARAVEAAEAPLVNPTTEAGAWRRIHSIDLSVEARRVWVEVPLGFTEMQQQQADEALEWRLKTREIFQTYFSRGYRAVDFELQKEQSRGRYLLAAKSP